MSDENHEETGDGGESLDFIRTIVHDDVESGKHAGIITRFPPEPNGYLHIGHATAVCLNFGVAAETGGRCNLRFDDTNPAREDVEYVDGIIEDVSWLGFDLEDRVLYASDYFGQIYEWTVQLVRDGKAYVDSLSAEEIRDYRGGWDAPGRESPYRDRSLEESLELLERMRAGEFEDGEHVVRAKIDMAAGNMNLRDPTLLRIRKDPHHRTGDTWCVYPMYDWAHTLSDAIEGITHSLCTLEFEDHRPLYDWILDNVETPSRPRQIEFARFGLNYTITSKRKLRQLVEEAHVKGWDDPRMPTLAALRRRGFTPEAIRDMSARVGITKSNSVTDIAVLEHALREDLNRRAQRRMAVLRPLKVVIENYPAGESESLEAVNNPEDETAGTRQVPFSRELYIERDDFMEEPPKKFFRLAPGREVRLRYGYFLTCREAVKDDTGEIVELRCTFDPETRGGSAPDGRKVRATLHWVSAQHAIDAEVRLYDRLFRTADPEEGGDFLANLNPDSLEILNSCKLEPALSRAVVGDRLQFERLGYFCLDPDSSPESPVFNRTVTLRDAWVRLQKGQKPK
ncbi:MAG: glutamine--tRNA ligase/YqeY domain fusion protein [Acidobacteriota bacterium]|nr:glutamine--tRNA ligase/YqeY domain fusion protein [Acidobacteriota bacterium]